MKLTTKILLGASIAVALAGCDTVNSGLSAVNNTLGSVNSAIGGGGSRPVGAGGGAVYVPAETKQMAASAFAPAPDRQLNAMIASAKPAITNMVGLSACGAKRSQMGQYTDPSDSLISYMDPMSSMQYHKAGCVNPIRVTGWQKKSANAFSFIVDYVSPQSQESARRDYTAIQQPTGEWLFRWSKY